MDDPVQDITGVIQMLTQGSPKEQKEAISTYLTPDAEFIHPFCRTWSFQGSRWLILKIYQWYKIMSPRIEIEINGIAYDEANLNLYVNLTQVFSIWIIPFHHTRVNLDTKLQLTQLPNSQKYYIKSQNDLYAVDQFVRFVLPWGVGPAIVYFWHFWATLFSVLGSFLLTPVIWLEQAWAEGRIGAGGSSRIDRKAEWEELKERALGEQGGNSTRQVGNLQVMT